MTGGVLELSFQNSIKEDYLQIFRVADCDLSQIRVSYGKIFVQLLKNRGFRAVFLYRIGRICRVKHLKFVSALIERLIHHLCFCEISTLADIGPGFALFHPFGLVVGTDVRSAGQLTLSMDVVLGGDLHKTRSDGSSKPRLGKNVNIASGSKVVGPVDIGDNVLIGANSVVISDLPSNCVAVGAPARVIKLNGKTVSMLEQKTELTDILKKLQQRVEAIEKKLEKS